MTFDTKKHQRHSLRCQRNTTTVVVMACATISPLGNELTATDSVHQVYQQKVWRLKKQRWRNRKCPRASGAVAKNCHTPRSEMRVLHGHQFARSQLRLSCSHLFVLTNQDLNTIPIVNKTCREPRDNDSLDQTCTTTIICLT